MASMRNKKDFATGPLLNQSLRFKVSKISHRYNHAFIFKTAQK